MVREVKRSGIGLGGIGILSDFREFLAELLRFCGPCLIFLLVCIDNIKAYMLYLYYKSFYYTQQINVYLFYKYFVGGFEF